MKRRYILFLCSMFCIFSSLAQELTAMRDSVADSYNFWLYEPITSYEQVLDTTAGAADDSQEDTLEGGPDVVVSPVRKPLIVFLHGKSLSGTDLNIVRRYGTINALEMGMDIDAYVVAPQTNNGWNAGKVWKIVDWCIEHYAIDTNRIYVLGMSMGGYGTINTSAVYAEKIAAAMALCGGGSGQEFCKLCTMPLWIMHGTGDKSVPVSASDRVVDAMIECGDTSRLIYSRMPNQNHSILARVFYLKETYDWLFAHSLQDSVRSLCRAISITEAHFPDAYKHLHGKKGHITMRNGTSVTDTYTTPQPTSSSSSGSYHIVKKGDSLFGIAQANHTTVKKLCQLNGLKESSILQIGQKIKLK